jgi:hypothetical protein
MTFLRARLLAVAAIALSTTACGASSFNVRASRAFSNEDMDPDVDADRVADVAKTHELVDELLLKTPFDPSDAWIQKLPLTSEHGDELMKAAGRAHPYEPGDFEVPTLKPYRAHLEEVLTVARASRAHAARFPNVARAIESLGVADLGARWEAFANARRTRNAKVVVAEGNAILGMVGALHGIDSTQGDKAVIAHAATQAVSLALRAEQEASAIAPYAEKHAISLSKRRREYERLASDARAARWEAEREVELLGPVADGLAASARLDLGVSAGFLYHESFVDQVVGVQFDATRVHVKADSEVLFFHQAKSNASSGSANDYTGREHRLSYTVQPIFMVGARIIAAYDWLHIKNIASLNAGFTTDRITGSGGTIENSNSLGQLIGLKGLASDFFDMGVGLAGVNTNVRLATFTSGKIHEIGIDPTTDADKGETRNAPFQLVYKQIDVAYDLTVPFPVLSEDYYVEALLPGFRYMDYRLPRVFYELGETPPTNTVYDYSLLRESPVQNATSKFFMGGISARFGQGDWDRVSFYGDIGIYGGAGPVGFYFLKDKTQADTEANRDQQKATMFAVDGSATLGMRLRLTPRRSRFRVITEVLYHGEIIGQGIVSEIRETDTKSGETIYSVGKKVDVGGFDLFHGPRLRLVLSF